MTSTGDTSAEDPAQIETQLVTRTDHDGIVTLTLDRPEKLNALNLAVFVTLRQHLDDLAGNDTVRCVVLRGAGRAFCAGHDLESISKRERAPTKHFEPEVIDQLVELAVPTIAQVHGFCLTGGLELALACDLIVAGSSARLGDTHSKWGLAPMWGMSVRLPERVGVSKAKELMFTSRVIGAGTAAEIGLVDRCVPDDELDETVNALALEICSTSAGTNAIVKRLIADRTRLDAEGRLQRERSHHYGVPADMHERLGTSGR
jgi:enoyl-CoA hydratase/carnithine racemase